MGELAWLHCVLHVVLFFACLTAFLACPVNIRLLFFRRASIWDLKVPLVQWRFVFLLRCYISCSWLNVEWMHACKYTASHARVRIGRMQCMHGHTQLAPFSMILQLVLLFKSKKNIPFVACECSSIYDQYRMLYTYRHSRNLHEVFSHTLHWCMRAWPNILRVDTHCILHQP